MRTLPTAWRKKYVGNDGHPLPGLTLSQGALLPLSINVSSKS